MPCLTLAALEGSSRGGEGKSTVLKPQAKSAGEAVPQNLGVRLEGEQLALISAEEKGKWPLRLRALVIVVLAALAWLAVLYLPGLMTELAGLVLGLLLRAII